MLKRLLKKVFTNELLIEPAEFVIKVAMVYAIWRGFKYCGETYPGFLWGGWAAFYDIVGNLLAAADSVILNLLEVRHLHDKRVIIVEGQTELSSAICVWALLPCLFTAESFLRLAIMCKQNFGLFLWG
jgi:hypothetical protein